MHRRWKCAKAVRCGVCDGMVWGAWRGALPGGNKRPDRPVMTALERGGYDDYGERRPAVPELRLADMDRDGVHAHVIYGPVFSINADDHNLSVWPEKS